MKSRHQDILKQMVSKKRTVLSRDGDTGGITGPTGPTGPEGPTGESSTPQIITFVKQTDFVGGIYNVIRGGNYCLQEDVTGTIVVSANHVCFDLCCFHLRGGGLANAVIMKNVDNVQILNGSISNTVSAGILIEGCNSTSISDIRMFDHKLDMMRIASSNGIEIAAVNFDSNNDGERALHFDDCNGVSIDLCGLSGFLSTIGALIELENCDTVSVQNIDIYGNTKSLKTQNSPLDVSASLMHSANSTGVYMQYVKFNNNVIDNRNQGNRYFNALGFVNCISSSLYHLETGSNVNVSGVAPNGISVDNMILIANCSNFITIDCQLNDNSVTVPTTGFYGVHVVDSNNITFYGCQANSNYVKSLPFNPSVDSGLAGFFMENAKTAPTENNVIGNCQANYNRVDDGGVRQRGGLLARVFGIIAEGSMTIDICQTSHNTMGSSGTGQRAGGILCLGSENINITNSVANNNKGGELAVGIHMKSSNDASQFNNKVMNVTANSNEGYGIIVGEPFPNSNTTVDNVTLMNCTCNKNGHNSAEAAGIYIVNNVKNVLVKSCQINETYSFGTLAAGIRVSKAGNITIDDTIVNSTNGTCVGHGILLEGVRNSKVVRSQMTDNDTSGIEITGCSNNSISVIECTANCNRRGYSVDDSTDLTNGLFKENVAMNNTDYGFLHEAPTFSSGYVSNYAQGNGNDYYVVGGVISVHKLGFNDGKTQNVTGNTAVSHWTNISAA